MARGTIQICSECGFQTAQWLGQCPGCEAWNTLVEERIRAARGAEGRGGGGRARGARVAAAGGATSAQGAGLRLAPRLLSEVGAAPVARMSTGVGELDRVLGGGLVPGALVLLGGSPGIGKSTLTNMVLGNLAQAGRRTLYVSGEESAEQVRLRAERLVLNPTRPTSTNHALDVPILAETDLDTVLATLAGEAPDVCVIDSVQTLNAAELSGAPGSVVWIFSSTRFARSSPPSIGPAKRSPKSGACRGSAGCCARRASTNCRNC